MLRFSVTIVLFCAFCLGIQANQIDTYTYTGNQFTSFLNYSCPPQCSISGDFVGEIETDFLLSYSFTDGNTVWNQNNSVVHDFTVTSTYNSDIASYDISFLKDVSGVEEFLDIESGNNFGFNDGTVSEIPDVAIAYNGNPGTWSVTPWSVTPSMDVERTATPEPSAIVFLSFCTIG